MSDDSGRVSIDQDRIKQAREIQNARNSSSMGTNKELLSAYEDGYGNAIIAIQNKPKASKPICKIIFDVPYYFCGNCKTMLNMYSTKAKFCSQCGQVVQWG